MMDSHQEDEYPRPWFWIVIFQHIKVTIEAYNKAKYKMQRTKTKLPDTPEVWEYWQTCIGCHSREFFLTSSPEKRRNLIADKSAALN